LVDSGLDKVKPGLKLPHGPARARELEGVFTGDPGKATSMTAARLVPGFLEEADASRRALKALKKTLSKKDYSNAQRVLAHAQASYGIKGLGDISQSYHWAKAVGGSGSAANQMDWIERGVTAASMANLMAMGAHASSSKLVGRMGRNRLKRLIGGKNPKRPIKIKQLRTTSALMLGDKRVRRSAAGDYSMGPTAFTQILPAPDFGRGNPVNKAMRWAEKRLYKRNKKEKLLDAIEAPGLGLGLQLAGLVGRGLTPQTDKALAVASGAHGLLTAPSSLFKPSRILEHMTGG